MFLIKALASRQIVSGHIDVKAIEQRNIRWLIVQGVGQERYRNLV